jgi:hypothetical protein
MTGSDRRCIWPLTIARSLASRKPWRALAVDGGGSNGSARAGGMTGLDRRRSFVCQPEFHGRLGEMSERVVAIIAVAIIAGSVSLSWGCCTVLVWRRLLLLLLLRVVVPWASQFSTS